MRKHFLLFLACCGIAGCSQNHFADQPAQNAAGEVGCKSFESSLWDVSYSSLIEGKVSPAQVPMAKIVSNKFSTQASSLKGKTKAQQALAQKVSDFYRIIGVSDIQTMSLEKQLEKLTALEVGDTTTPEAAAVQEKLKTWRAELAQTYQQYDITCSQPPTEEGPGAPATPIGKNPIVWGADKALAVAYQSCRTEAQPPMTSATPGIQGITVLGESHGGTIRKITGMAQFLSSNYYYQNFNLQQNCRDVRVKPMIYNYGGKPYTTSATNSSLDFFTSTGEGVSPELGIDCSGYVFSSIATAGLRLSPGKQLKAVLVHGINSVMYMNPDKNGMSCLQKVSMGISGTLKAGDILAEDGHVVIIEQVGTDPLGILAVQRESDCDSLSAANFNFIISQSSSTKNGIGINKYVGRDYLQDSGAFKTGLEQYAHQACHARFAHKDVAVSSSQIQVVRHKLTADCKQSAIPLVGEACVSQCYAAAD
jgi:hypothetical protein